MPAVAGPGGLEALARPGGGEGLHAALLGHDVEDAHRIANPECLSEKAAVCAAQRMDGSNPFG